MSTALTLLQISALSSLMKMTGDIILEIFQTAITLSCNMKLRSLIEFHSTYQEAVPQNNDLNEDNLCFPAQNANIH